MNHSLLIDDGVSAKPFTFSRSAVFRNAGSCSCDTLTSPAYINSKIACRCEYETSFKIIIGCLDGFSYEKKSRENKFVKKCYISSKNHCFFTKPWRANFNLKNLKLCQYYKFFGCTEEIPIVNFVPIELCPFGFFIKAKKPYCTQWESLLWTSQKARKWGPFFEKNKSTSILCTIVDCKNTLAKNSKE